MKFEFIKDHAKSLLKSDFEKLTIFCQNHEISRKLTIFFRIVNHDRLKWLKKYLDKFSILSYMLGNPSNQLSKRIGFVVVFSKTRLIPIHVCFDIFFVYVIHNI